MSLPTSLRAYADCQQLFDAAVADPKGVRACLGTYEACVNMRTRLHYYRSLDRESNASIYPKGNPMHGTSRYDDFVVQIIKDEDGMFWVYLEPRSAKILYIEGLSDVGGLIDAPTIEHNPTETEAYEVHQIEDRSNG